MPMGPGPGAALGGRAVGGPAQPSRVINPEIAVPPRPPGPGPSPLGLWAPKYEYEYRSRWGWRELESIRGFLCDILAVRNSAPGSRRGKPKKLQEIAVAHWT